jgi:hypothetical protein
MSEIELGWLAGIFEGEGTIVLPPAQRRHVTMSLNSTDRDVIERLVAVTGVGHIYGPFANDHQTAVMSASGKKPIWRWTVSRRAEVARLLLAMYPLLSDRRQKRVQDAVQKMMQPKIPGGPKNPIKHGTRSGYRRETRERLAHCADCTRANTEYLRQRRLAKVREAGLKVACDSNVLVGHLDADGMVW